MRVLLDENLPRKLARHFEAGVEVVTVAQHRWNGRRNGDLLYAAQSEFDVFVTTDKGIPHQQNLRLYAIGIIVIRGHRSRLQDILLVMDRVNEAVAAIGPGEVIVITA